jgi:hypothetical protein
VLYKRVVLQLVCYKQVKDCVISVIMVKQSASQEYGSAYDRFMRNQEALYSRLSGLAGIGQQATGAATGAGASAARKYWSNYCGWNYCSK